MIPLANGINKIKKADLCHSPGIEVPMTGRIIERVTYIQLIVQKGRYYQVCTGNAIGA